MFKEKLIGKPPTKFANSLLVDFGDSTWTQIRGWGGGTPGTPDVANEDSGGIVGLSSKHL